MKYTDPDESNSIQISEKTTMSGETSAAVTQIRADKQSLSLIFNIRYASSTF